MFRIARSRWAIAVQYRDLKTELGLDHFEGRSYPGWQHHAVLAAMTFTFLQLEPLPTFPEIHDLVREVMAALLWTARPSWLKLAISFSGIRRSESDKVVLRVRGSQWLTHGQPQARDAPVGFSALFGRCLE